MRIRNVGMLTSVAVAAFLVGCAGGGSNVESFPDPYAEKEVKIFVTNLAFMDATIWGITHGGRRRLGQVTGKKEIVFTLPLTVSSELYLEIDILAGPKCYTERMMVDPGDHLDLVIQNEGMHWRCRGS